MIASLGADTELLDRAPILVDDGPGRRVLALIIVVRHAIVIVIVANARDVEDNRRGFVFDDLGKEALRAGARALARTSPFLYPVARIGHGGAGAAAALADELR